MSMLTRTRSRLALWSRLAVPSPAPKAKRNTTEDVTYIFPHVPKCGGTSLLKNLESARIDAYFDYDAWVGPAVLRRNREAARLDFSTFDIIFGHFPVDRYRSSNFRYIALVRDPIDRCISNYDYLRKRWDLGMLPPGVMNGRIAKAIHSGEMSFIEYLENYPQMCHVYRTFLGYWSASRFSLIGRTENYSAFLEHLSELLGVKFTNRLRERRSESKRTELGPREMERARKLLSAEYKWFDEFVKHVPLR